MFAFVLCGQTIWSEKFDIGRSDFIFVSAKEIICDAKHWLSGGKTVGGGGVKWDQKSPIYLQLLTRFLPAPTPTPPRLIIFLWTSFAHLRAFPWRT